MIGDMFNSGSLPVLERLTQFTTARHEVLVDNIANLSTPYFKPRDLDPTRFQKVLAEAIDRRRAAADPVNTPLRPADTAEFRFRPGGIETRPTQSNEGILFHDQNNRDLERIMQHLAENTLAHNMTIELMRGELATLRMAIRDRF